MSSLDLGMEYRFSLSLHCRDTSFEVGVSYSLSYFFYSAFFVHIVIFIIVGWIVAVFVPMQTKHFIIFIN